MLYFLSKSKKILFVSFPQSKLSISFFPVEGKGAWGKVPIPLHGIRKTLGTADKYFYVW